MGSMSISATLSNELGSHSRRAVLSVTGSASYATGGDTLDLSALTGGGMTVVFGVARLSVSAHGNDKYALSYVPAAAGAPATGKIKIRDLAAGTPGAEVSSTTDLSAVSWTVEVIGS